MSDIIGIPDRSSQGDLSNLPKDKLLTLVRQLHRAKRAGTHQDFRIGDENGLFSWAIPKGLSNKQNRLAVRQPLHSYDYKDFHGSIPSGYGQGTVETIEQVPAAVVQNSGDKITIVKGNSRNPQYYTLVKTKGDNYIAIPNKEHDIPVYQKQHFKQLPYDPAKILALGMSSPKIDGAGAIVRLLKDKAQVYSIRRSKDNKPIQYTDKLGGLRDLDIPKELVGKSFRAQVGGTKYGKVMSPNDIAGLLNSSVLNAIQKRNRQKIEPHIYALALLQNNKQNWKKRDALQALVRKLNLKSISTLPLYQPQEAQKQMKLMESGKHPLTKQGLVFYTDNGPVKMKLKKDADVVLRKIFQADSQNKRAGGFEYSLPGDQKIVGKVGTGFTHKQLKDMLQNPQDYIGRTARISAQQQYPSGAYRAPSFIAMKED